MAVDEVDRVRAQRERWRRAKRAQRGSPVITVLPVSSDFKLAVLAERDRRLERRYMDWLELDVPDYEFFWRRSRFATNVWAARTLLVAELGEAGNSPTRVARWLRDEGLAEHYSEDSVRPMVYEAFKVIKELESVCMKGSNEPFWAPFKFNAAGD